MDILKCNSCLAFGSTSHAPFGSIYASTASESNILAMRTSNTFFAALRTETYDIVEDWAGDLYCSINLEWNYAKQWVDIAMPTYVIKNFTQYSHPTPLKLQHCP